MPPAKQAYHSAYRTNSHSLRSTNACGHKPKKQFCKSSVFYSSKIIKNDPKILLYGPQINQIKQIIFLISKIMWEISVRLFEQRCHIDGENSCLLLLLIIFCGDKETFAYSGWILIPFQAATLPNRLIYADIWWVFSTERTFLLLQIATERTFSLDLW